MNIPEPESSLTQRPSARKPPRAGKAKQLHHFRVLDPRGVIWHGATVPAGELITTATPGQHIARWTDAKRVQPVADPGAGRCSSCGCTWTKACPGGCSWANVERTLCSHCLSPEEHT